MSPQDSLHERFLRKAIWLTALGIAVLCAAVFVAIGPRAAATAPLPVQALRVGLAPASLPVSTGERDYTNGGFEAVYAQELARQLGVPVQLVPLPHEAQAQALRQGQVDLVLARPDHPDQPEEGLRVLATGYQSGLSVAMRSDTDVRAWKDLVGRVLCTSSDNARAQAQAAALGGSLKVFAAPAQALAQVRTGACAAALLDRAPLDALFAKNEWAKFSATLPPTDPSALVAWVADDRADLAAPLRAAVAQLGSTVQWEQRRQKWASNVAFEVYFDQIGPDCH